MEELRDCPDGATHILRVASYCTYLRIKEYVHDYWSLYEERWITFEGGHNPIRKNWTPLFTSPREK